MKRPFYLIIFFLTISIKTISGTEFIAGAVYKISTFYTGNRTLSTQHSSLDNDAAVHLWTETKANSQRWRLTEADDGSFFLDNVYSGKRLCVQATSIMQKNPDNTNMFKWIFQPADGSTNGYYIENVSRSGCLGLVSDDLIEVDGSTIRIYNKLSTQDNRQIWKIEQVEEVPNVLTPAIREEMMDSWRKRYFSWLKSSNGFWGEAELMEIILDAYESTGKEEYKIMFEEVYSHFVSGSGGWGQPNGKNWMWNEYNDDIAWGVLASIRAHFMFGSHPDPTINYYDIAKNNFDNMYKRAIHKVDNLYYLLRWKEGQAGTTSCVNGPAEIAACYLGIASNDDLYFQKAKMLYESQRIHMFEPSTGRVYDTFDNNWASTYNQGTYLGAAVMLYNRYGEAMYKKDAEMIMKYTLQHLCNSNGIVSVCGSETGDYPNFKAILMRYARRFVEDLGKIEYGTWLQKNALQAYNNRNSNGISRVAWWEKTGEEDNWNSFGSCAAVSAAMNAPIDLQTIHKDAFTPIQSGSFNYISKMYSENNLEGEYMELTSIENNAYLGYNLIDCNNQSASGIELNLSNDAVERTIEVRLSSPTGTLLTTINIPASNNSWSNIQSSFDTEVKGTNNIYLIFKGDKNGLRFKSFKLISAGTNYSEIIANDITDDGGALSEQFPDTEDDDILKNLVDNSAETNYVVENQKGFWVQYKAQSRYILSEYSISSSNDTSDRDPKDWILYGSGDGTNWKILDARKNQSFDKRKATLAYSCASDEAYQYFRLNVTDNNGSTSTMISEWQIFGSKYHDVYSQDYAEISACFSEGADSAQLVLMHDNNPSTACNFNASQMPIIIEYELPVAIQLLGYDITSNDTDSKLDPKSWKLHASNDGENWVTVDARGNQSFECRNLKRAFIRTSNYYRFFKLEITAINDETAQSLSIGEFELHGHSINNYDLTSDSDGKISAQWTGNYKVNDETGTVSVDERFYQLIDKTKAKKYLASNRKSFWTTFQSSRPAKLFAYSLTSANDAPNRDPKSWTLSGSNNNSSWTIIDKQENQIFNNRYATLHYTCSTSNSFKYFKLEVQDNQGEKSVQLGEWQLFATFNTYKPDITENGGVLTASHPATDGTDLMALIDNDETTKYYLNATSTNFAEGIWFVYESPVDVLLSSYSLTSSDDNPNNDPKDWKLLGSNDTIEWTEIDTQSDIIFEKRGERKIFLVSSKTPHKYYKIHVTGRRAENYRGFQIAEWELFGTETADGIQRIGDQLTTAYPNPARDFITIKSTLNGTIEILDINSIVIFKQDNFTGTRKINLSTFSEGMYFITIRSQKEFETLKFVKY